MIWTIYLFSTMVMIVTGIFLIRNISIDGDLELEEWLRVSPLIIGLFLLAAPFAYGALQGKDSNLDYSYQSQPVQQLSNQKRVENTK